MGKIFLKNVLDMKKKNSFKKMLLSIFIVFFIFSCFSCSKFHFYFFKKKCLMENGNWNYNLMIDNYCTKSVNNIEDKEYNFLYDTLTDAPITELFPLIIVKLNSDIDISKKEALIKLFNSILILKNYFSKEDKYSANQDYKEMYDQVIDNIIKIVKEDNLSHYNFVVHTLYFSDHMNREKALEMFPKMIEKCGYPAIDRIFEMIQKSNNPKRIEVLEKISENKDEKIHKKAQMLLENINNKI